MEFQAKWIRTSEETGGVCPVFRKGWKTERKVERATLYLTALGVYEAHLNGKRVGKYVLAPGWTAYDKRLQYQEYDITDLLREENELTVTLGKGWFRSPMPGWEDAPDQAAAHRPSGRYSWRSAYCIHGWKRRSDRNGSELDLGRKWDSFQ